MSTEVRNRVVDFSSQSCAVSTLSDRLRSMWSTSQRRVAAGETHQERLGDHVLHYFQVMFYRLVLGVGTLHLLVSKETEQQRLILELTLFQH